MRIGTRLVAGLLTGLSLAAAAAAAPQEVPLSPALRAFLQSEMRGIASGVQAITVALATAEWDQVVREAVKIRDSYIRHRELSELQRRELEALPAGFHALDAAFHERAGRLAAAAGAHDGELAAYQLHRLVEGCVACHSQYVRYRFTGFGAPAAAEHEHQH